MAENFHNTVFLSDCSAGGNGYFMFADFWCAMPSRDGEQVEYVIDWYFNQEFTMQYNSTAGSWTGLTAAGRITASQFNGDKYDVQQRKAEKQLICADNVETIFSATEENMGEYSTLDACMAIMDAH